MKYLVTTPAHTADKDKEGFKATMATALGVNEADIILIPQGVTVTAIDVPGLTPAAAKAKKKKDESVPPEEITRLCKQLHEEEDGVNPHDEDHEETVKKLTEIGEPAVPELRKWSAIGNGPGNKRCSDLADQLDKKKSKTDKTEHDVKEIKHHSKV